jgi:transcriptional regulator with XRE-family HTH domain
MDDLQLLIQVGRRIRSLREQKGISQQDLAAKCNFEKSNLSRIEAGKNNLTLKTLNKISTALEVSIVDLLDSL